MLVDPRSLRVFLVPIHKHWRHYVPADSSRDRSWSPILGGHLSFERVRSHHPKRAPAELPGKLVLPILPFFTLSCMFFSPGIFQTGPSEYASAKVLTIKDVTFFWEKSMDLEGSNRWFENGEWKGLEGSSSFLGGKICISLMTYWGKFIRKPFCLLLSIFTFQWWPSLRESFGETLRFPGIRIWFHPFDSKLKKLRASNWWFFFGSQRSGFSVREEKVMWGNVWSAVITLMVWYHVSDLMFDWFISVNLLVQGSELFGASKGATPGGFDEHVEWFTTWSPCFWIIYMGVSKNRGGYPQSSI